MNAVERETLIKAVIENPEAAEDLMRVFMSFCRDMRKALDALEEASEPIVESIEKAMEFVESIEQEGNAYEKEHDNVAN